MFKRLSIVLASMMLTLSAFAASELWVIDPGHGGHDLGCHTRRNREKDITLAISKEVGRLIKQEIKGVRIIYTRERDTYPSLPERCNLANRRGAALFLSIHVNDAPNTFAHGTESYFATNVPLSGAQAGKSELLALLLQQAYLEHGRVISRGVKQRGWYVCENTNMPSVLTEVGFLSNLEEEAFMASKSGQATLARAIVDALKQWREMTKGRAVSRQKLRNLRFQYFDPRKQAAKSKTKASTSSSTKSKSKKNNSASAENKSSASSSKQPAAASQSAAEEIVATTDPNSSVSSVETPPAEEASPAQPSSAEETKASQPVSSSSGISFCIQIFSVAKPLKPNDQRLRGLKNVRFLEADGRYKALHGHVKTYLEATKLLAEVRKLFPDAFIIAFDGDEQISTAEAKRRMLSKH